MNPLYNRMFNALPDSGPENACFTVSGQGMKCAQVVKVLPTGMKVARFTMNENSIWVALYGTQGAGSFCIAQTGAACEGFAYGETGPSVPILPNTSIYLIKSGLGGLNTGRWVPVSAADESLLFHPQAGLAVSNPLATTAPAGLEENQTLTETIKNASTPMKVAAVVVVAALAWYLLK